MVTALLLAIYHSLFAIRYSLLPRPCNHHIKLLRDDSLRLMALSSTDQRPFTGRVNEFHVLVFDPVSSNSHHRQPSPRGMSSFDPRPAAACAVRSAALASISSTLTFGL